MEFDLSEPRKVVKLAMYRRHETLPEFQQLRGYWEALRPAGGLPTRAQIDPRGIEGILDRTFLLDRIAPGLVRMRLAGMHLNDLMGMDMRGMPLFTMFQPEARTRLGVTVEKVFTEPVITELMLEAGKGIGRTALTARMLILPLADEQGRVTRALGCLVSEGKIGRTPRRFSIVATRNEDVEIAAAPPYMDAPPAPARETAPGLAEPAAAFSGAAFSDAGEHMPDKPERSHLRVVK